MEIIDRVEEHFVQIPFFENYAVSNYGTVINLKTEVELAKRVKKHDNRLRVRFYVLGAYIDFYVDELVAQAFFVDWQPGVEIYYKNGLRDDCTVLNLTFDPKYKED